MGLLDSLLGDTQQRQDYGSFVNRYQQGHPSQGYDDHEVAQRYSQVAPQLSPREYEHAARQSYERLSPGERRQFAGYLQQQGQQHGYNAFPDADGDGRDDRYEDPAVLARATTQMHQQQPGLLSGMLGGGGVGGNLGRAVLGGIAAMAVSNALGSAMGGGGGGLLGGVLGGGGGQPTIRGDLV